MVDPVEKPEPDPEDLSDAGGEGQQEETVFLGSSSDVQQVPTKKKKKQVKQDDPRVGTSLGKYQVVGVLGRGGMGVVYQGYDPIIDRRVALKLLPQEVAETDDEAFRRLLLEAQTAGRLNHQNTVGVYDAGLEGDTYYLVLELVTGGNVLERLVKKRYSWIEATQVLADACRGVAAAHAQDMIHRDIKPANLMFTETGGVKVADFGLASAPGLIGASLSNVGDILGTPHYMSPEQCESKPVDQRTDIYSLGATYFTLLTAERPFDDADTAMQVMYAHVHHEPPDPLAVQGDIPTGCKAIIERAMAKDPADRYQSVEEMLDALGTLLSTASDTKKTCETDRTMRVSSSETKRIPAQRSPQPSKSPTDRRWVLAMSGIALVAVLGFIGWMAFGGRSGRQARQANPQSAGDLPPLKIGILHSLSGTMSFSETPVVEATKLAIEQINRAGGIHGRSVEVIVIDGKSEVKSFASGAEKLIAEHGVHTIFGCWTSASRKSVREVVEKHDHLLIYPLHYEGLEQSPNIVDVGATANQHIVPAVNWFVGEQQLKRVFVVGSDDVFSRAASEIIRDYVKQFGGTVIGADYRTLGATNFTETLKAIAAARPTVIFNTINGDSNLAFFRALQAQQIQATATPVVSFNLDGNLARGLAAKHKRGHYVVGSYFASIQNDLNQRFLADLAARFGDSRVATGPMVSAYCAVYLWAQAVEDSGSDVKKIRTALRNRSFQGPANVRVDAETQHTWRIPRIAQFDKEGKLKIVFTGATPVKPIPYPATRSTESWKNFLHDLHSKWGSAWSAP